MFEITCPTHQHQTLTPVMLYFVQIDCLLGDFGAKKSFQNVINNLFPLYERSNRDPTCVRPRKNVLGRIFEFLNRRCLTLF